MAVSFGKGSVARVNFEGMTKLTSHLLADFIDESSTARGTTVTGAVIPIFSELVLD